MLKSNLIEEATDRLVMLKERGLWSEVVRMWKKYNKASVSIKTQFTGNAGINFLFSEKPELQAMKESFETKYNCLVYYGMYSKTSFGELLTLLYVSDEMELWDFERENLNNGCAFAYVWNLDFQFGEIGTVGFDVIGGGLVRSY